MSEGRGRKLGGYARLRAKGFREVRGKAIMLACRFEKDVFDKIVRHASKANVSAAEVVRQMVDLAIEQAPPRGPQP